MKKPIIALASVYHKAVVATVRWFITYLLFVIYAGATALVLWGVGITIAVVSAEKWSVQAWLDWNISPEPWELVAIMIIILAIITFLSLLPVLIFIAFDMFSKKNVLQRSKWELQHYNMENKKLMREIAARFYSAQEPQNYRVPILLATSSMTAGWVLVFFINGAGSLCALATGKLSILFSSLATADPVVFGFLGAVFFSLQMMLRRFFVGDIRPSVFMHIGVRTWLVIVLTMVIGAIWTWPGREDGTLAPRALLAISFIVGVFPNIGFELIQKKAIPFIKNRQSPNGRSLDKIWGLNVWRQARLAEEGIDSVPSLATCDVVGLIANTRLGIMLTLHWVDQALLFVYAGESNFEKFLKAGICTATALECAYAGQLEEPERERQKFENDRKQGKYVTYMGRIDLTYIPEAPLGLVKSLGEESEWSERLRNMMIAICDDVNYQRLWRIRHGIVNVEQSPQ